MHTGVPRYLFEKSSRPALAERRLHRSVVMLTLLAGALLLTGCEKKEEKPKPGPPEVRCGRALAAERAHLTTSGWRS